VLLDLPVVLGWMVKGVKQLVHPDTRHKFRVVQHPHQQALLQPQAAPPQPPPQQPAQP
jgi:hypothetical protein